MIIRKNKNYILRPEVDVGEIFEHVGCKMLTLKLLKLKWTQESLPQREGLDIFIFFFQSEKRSLRNL